MSDLTATSPHDDDELRAEAEAEQLADKLLELAIASPGPVRLACLQMMGLVPPPGSSLSQDTLAATMGIGRKRIRTLEARFLATLRRQLSPDLTETEPQQ